MNKKMAGVVFAAVLSAGALGAGHCEPAQASQGPQFQKVYGTVEKLDSTASTMTIRLKNPPDAAVTVKLTEWTRVVRENEDLSMRDLRAGASVMLVYRTMGKELPEAETINLEDKS